MICQFSYAPILNTKHGTFPNRAVLALKGVVLGQRWIAIWKQIELICRNTDKLAINMVTTGRE